MCWSGSQNLEKDFTHWVTNLSWKDTTEEEPDGRDALGKVCGKAAEPPWPWVWHSVAKTVTLAQHPHLLAT